MANIYTVAKIGDITRFKELFDISDLNAKSKYGSGLLHYAISGRHFDIAMFLLETGIDVNMIDGDDQTALHLICMKQTHDLTVAKSILERGVDVDIIDVYGNPAIWTAAFNTKGVYYAMVELMMAYNPDITIKNKVGLSVLDLAIRFDDDYLYELLSTQ